MAMDLRQKAKARLERETGSAPVNMGASVRFALAFPNVYGVAMASLGYQLVHQMLNSIPRASSERVFMPDPVDLKEHERTHTELFTLDTQTPLAAFDVVAFSISFEFDYANMLRMLQLANIPIEAADRDERNPIVIAGGPCATFNPEPLADFVDAFVVGEAEAVLPELVAALDGSLGEDRSEVLAAIAQVPGVYVPSLYTPHYSDDGALARVAAHSPAPDLVRRAVAPDLSDWPGSSAISTPEAEFGEIRLVEIARGCGRKCRFCVAGHITRPPRPREVGELSGDSRYGLVGAAVFDHPCAADICGRIVEAGGEFSLSSVRLETITPELAQLMARGGQKTMTIAPEAATERLRRVINKNASDEHVLSAVSAAGDAGISRVKLYFMIGLPTETDEDVDAIAVLARRLAREFPAIQFQLSVSTFVPKPWTPFQWYPMEREGALKRRYAALKRQVSPLRSVRLSGESPRLALVQGLLSRGDRRVGRVIAAALEHGCDYGPAMREVDADWYLHRPRDRGEALPWDHIDARISKDYLWNEYQNGLKEVASAPCRVGSCKLCGACE